jgi:hypothetical protein
LRCFDDRQALQEFGTRFEWLANLKEGEDGGHTQAIPYAGFSTDHTAGPTRVAWSFSQQAFL